jgi:membrane-associated phospholipid phosphatase
MSTITASSGRTWLAWQLSRYFPPPLLPVITGAAVSWRMTQPDHRGLLWGLGGSGAWALLSAALAVTGRRLGWWPSSVSSQRRPRLMLLTASVLVAAAVWLVCERLGAPPPLLAAGRTAVLLVALVLACTCFSNISLHTNAAAASITLMTVWLDASWAVLYLLVAAIAWSRLHLRAHTPAQVLLGAVLGTVVCMAMPHLSR